MTSREAEELIKEVEHFAMRKMAKNVYNQFSEGKNYGIMLMYEITKELIEKRIEK